MTSQETQNKIEEILKEHIDIHSASFTEATGSLLALLEFLSEKREKEVVGRIKLCAKEQSCSMCKEYLGKVKR